MSGGLLSITSRILVVDMLTKNVPTEMITGLLMMHADKSVALLFLPWNFRCSDLALSVFRVNQTSMEAFIVRLYRQSNHVRPASSLPL